MTLKRKKRLAVGLLTVALLGLSSMTALANTVFYNNAIPAFQEHGTITTGRKSNSYSKCASNYISDLSNDNRYAWCWVDNLSSGQRSQVTNTVRCDIRLGRDIFYHDSPTWTGPVELRAFAEHWGFNRTTISGHVDFG